MLEKYREKISAMCDEAVEAVSEGLRLPADGETLYDALERQGCSQADVALVLLRDGRPQCRAALAVLVGREVQVVPPPEVWPRPYPRLPGETGPDARRVLRVERNPRLPTTGAFQRYKNIRVGLTVAQLLARGVTRRDIREVVAAGVVELEETR